MITDKDTCPECGAPLTDIIETSTGKRLRRCSNGFWNQETNQIEGCPYVLWLSDEDEELNEKCPECGAPLVLRKTRSGKLMKKCSRGGWDSENKKPIGCPYVEWIDNNTKKLNEKCPLCGEPLVLYTTKNGRKLKKCSTQGWDSQKREVTGCPYTYWLKPEEYEIYEDLDSNPTK